MATTYEVRDGLTGQVMSSHATFGEARSAMEREEREYAASLRATGQHMWMPGSPIDGSYLSRQIVAVTPGEPDEVVEG